MLTQKLDFVHAISDSLELIESIVLHCFTFCVLMSPISDDKPVWIRGK